MKHEIERKFLLAGDGWRDCATEAIHLRDGLVASFGGAKVRVRIASRCNAPQRAWVTLKGPRHGITRREFEYEIPVAEAEIMLEELCDGQVVEKTRHLVRHAGLLWEIDVYAGFLAGVIYAEVELEHAAQVVALPPWIGPVPIQRERRTL